ncbi:hypothetical protein ACFL2D_01930 [Patescibacteria group bacterium]
MKHLVTHIQPHLDDIVGVWLMKKYNHEFHDAEVTFTEVTAEGGECLGDGPVDDDPDYVHIGVCRGKFDEHAGKDPNILESATTLVWKYLIEQDLLPDDEFEQKAIESLVQYVLQEDTGKLRGEALAEFTAGAVIQGMNLFDEKDKNVLSHQMYDNGVSIIEPLLLMRREAARLEKDWESRTDFESPWGKAAALVTSSAEADNYAYAHDYVLVVIVNPDKEYRNIRASANSDVDLTNVHAELEKIDPEAEWYLHQSKKLLICGHDIAPSTKLSKTPLEKLIELVKKG